MRMDFKKFLAVEKFWKTPEFVEKLISILDPLSSLRLLIQPSAVDKETLQKSLSPKASYEAHMTMRRGCYRRRT